MKTEEDQGKEPSLSELASSMEASLQMLNQIRTGNRVRAWGLLLIGILFLVGAGMYIQRMGPPYMLNQMEAWAAAYQYRNWQAQVPSVTNPKITLKQDWFGPDGDEIELPKSPIKTKSLSLPGTALGAEIPFVQDSKEN